MGRIIKEVGQILKETRLQNKLDIKDVAHILKIRRIYLEGLETGDIAEIPGEVYIFGYLKEYANFLNLDVDEIIYCYKQDEQFNGHNEQDDNNVTDYDESGIRRLVKIFMTFPIIAGTTIGAFQTKHTDYNHKSGESYTINAPKFTINHISNKK